MSEIIVDIKKHIAVLKNHSNGWKTEANIVTWYDDDIPRLDIRDWNATHEHMSRGISLHMEEAKILAKALTEYFEGVEK